MTTSRWLRIAAGLALIQAVGHTAGAVVATPTSASAEATLRDAMAAFRFTVAGVERSYLDAYVGSGWMISIMLLSIAVLLWQLAGIEDASPRVARPLILTLATAFGGMTIVGVMYFVPPPTMLAAAITACLCAAGCGVHRTSRVDRGGP